MVETSFICSEESHMTVKRDMLNHFPIFFHCITGLIISSLGPPSTRRKEGDRSCERALEGKTHVAGHGLGGIWVCKIYSL